LEVARARSNLLPEVNLTGTGAFTGRDSDYQGAYRGAAERAGFDWTVGLEVNIPLGFREGRARLLQSKIRLGGGELARQQVEQDLRLQLRLARRALDSSIARITAATAARILAEEQFNQLRAQYGEGLSAIRDVLLAQDDMEQARLRELRARLDAAKSSVQLARFDGTLSMRHNLEWQIPKK
jgi:outer membrane protein TolC